VPGVTEAFNLIPIVSDILWYRFSPASWTFAASVLVAFALDDLRDESPRLAVSRYWAALALVLCTTAVAWVLARPIFHDLRGAYLANRWIAFSVGWPLLALTLATVAVWFRGGVAKTQWLAVLLCVDAVVLYSVPRFSDLKNVEYGGLAGVRFLQENLGLQRFYGLGPIAPNYGSYFGIASLNHNDMPIASRWTDFITRHLHANAGPLLFTGERHYDDGLPSPEEELLHNLAWYEWTATKYIVQHSGSAPFFESILQQTGAGHETGSVSLTAATEITGRLSVTGEPIPVASAVEVRAPSFHGTAQGTLKLRICAAECTGGQADAANLHDGQSVKIPLAGSLVLAPKRRMRSYITYEERGMPLAVWRFPATRADDRPMSAALEGFQDPGFKLRREWTSGDRRMPRRVHMDPAMEIYELRDPKPYFDVLDGSCKLVVESRTRLTADCDGPAALVRRELFFPGWSASANGTSLDIVDYGELFQRVALNGGVSQITFSYMPVRGREACWGFGLGVLGLGVCLAMTLRRRTLRPPG
jgi:hypothetical protein